MRMLKQIIKFYLLPVLLLMMVSGCVYYRTLNISPPEKEVITATYKYKNIILVYDHTNNQHYQIQNPVFGDSTLAGELRLHQNKHGRFHKAHKKRLRRRSFNVKGTDPLNTIHIYLNQGLLKTGAFSTTYDNISKIEIHETDVALSVLSSLSIPVVTAGAGVGLFFLLCECVCPYVESYDLDSNKFHGSLFPGAIFQSAEREDYLQLSNPITDEDGTLSLRVYNNMPEIEYINMIELYRVDNHGYEHVAKSRDHGFVGYNKLVSMSSAKSGNDQDALSILSNTDNQSFDFSNLNQTSELNTLVVSFDRDSLADFPLLSLDAKHSRWLEKVAGHLFSGFGRMYDEWLILKDMGNGNRWLKSQREQGVSMTVSIKKDGKWNTIGYFDNPGSLSYRNMVLPVDLSQHTDSLVEIKFQSAYKIWEIDKIAMSNDYKIDVNATLIPFTEIQNQDGIDVQGKIARDDKDYHIQDEGEFITLKTSQKVEGFNLFVKGKGYYHHAFHGKGNVDVKLLKSMKQKLAFHHLSKILRQTYEQFAIKN
jgi:hypothetical protein